MTFCNSSLCALRDRRQCFQLESTVEDTVLKTADMPSRLAFCAVRNLRRGNGLECNESELYQDCHAELGEGDAHDGLCLYLARVPGVFVRRLDGSVAREDDSVTHGVDVGIQDMRSRNSTAGDAVGWISVPSPLKAVAFYLVK